MRKLFTIGILLAFVAGCGTTPAVSSNTGEPPSASVPTADASADTETDWIDSNDPDAPPNKSGSEISAGAKPMGTERLINTEKFDARVTVALATDVKAEYGDAPYAVDVTVRMTRGTWTFGAARVQFIYGNGSAHDQIVDEDAPETAAEIDAPDSGTWRFLYEHPAAAGVGQGARIVISASNGKPLAAWLT
ncbi:hypothetical protein [Actinoplanes couchii]|uniref:DUF4352 domain-containing protein n=1 Tax=Actinoplanes couchii TaxID=403638 RepID=A0ABQ3XS11_9ACTN|nr:hypothetical protein [Actinoplanes couchii]MDR6318773.1 hypothetical protein [Actinoplanes couchii]GID61302.1 hypothetical protein Aco03nite_097060 [Actinoplanes couchii]